VAEATPFRGAGILILQRTKVCFLATSKIEHDIDGGFYFHGLAVEEVRTVAPLLDCVQRGLAEQGVAAEDAEVFDGSGFGDGGGEGDSAGDAYGSGDWGVDRGGPVEDVTFDHATGDGDAPRRCGAHGGRTVGMEDAGGWGVRARNAVLDSVEIDEGGWRWGGVGLHSYGYGDHRGCGKWVAEDCGLDRNGVGGTGLGRGRGGWWRSIESSSEKESRKALGVNERVGDQHSHDGEVHGEGEEHPAWGLGGLGTAGVKGCVFEHADLLGTAG